VDRAPFHIEPLGLRMNRTLFQSGSIPLDKYFKEQVTQDIKRRITACFIALDRSLCIAGYYTLASTSILLTDLPEMTKKKLPRYPSIPAIRMGRLAVDESFQKQGLGAALLADALKRSIQTEIAAYALVVDAKDEKAANFYQKHGFLQLGSVPLTFFLPLATAAAL
jgi:ribosomal protein S18 acetylase RimI-like enzyme